MAILDSDIKLLESAVMADTTDGGGAMTGTAVVDGASNNLFPDTSEMNRAFGVVQMRKVFGVAHTLDTDSLLGAHAIVVDDADDPLVRCTLLKTAGWSDTRTAAKDVIERYVVKGPRLTGRLMDAHYAGARTINMMDPGGLNFPASGDAIVLRKPDATEQYVRVIKVTVTQQTFTVPDALGGTFTANVAAVELGQALAYDFTGPPIQKVIPNEANYTAVYTTNVATGAEFCGVKPLAAAVAPGDLFVTTTGGIFTPLVPAATVETPIIDVLPLTTRSSLVNTSAATVVLPSVTHTLVAGAQIATPTSIKPGALTVAAGATTLTDDGLGNLNAGSTAVAAIDYKAGVVTFLPSSPNYGSVTTGITYTPATLAGASCFSMSYTITSANQGLAYTQAFQPLPGPGSFTISYMAQGRWYALTDNLAGKLEGADPSYGVGTLNYSTGSMAVTLGALPDVGSSLIVDYGDANAAKAVDAANLPARMGVDIPVPNKASAVGAVITWSRGATNYTATTGADGQFAGDATGSCDPGKGKIRWEPANFPDTGTVHVLYKSVPTDNTAITDNGGGSYTLTANLPVVRGSFSALLTLTWPPGVSGPASVQLYDRNTVLLFFVNGNEFIAGSINYATGAVVVNGTITVHGVSVTQGGAIPGWNFENYSQVLTGSFAVGGGALSNVRYSSGVESTVEFDHTLVSYTANAGTYGRSLRSTDLLFTLGGEVYSGAAGALRRGWSLIGTGAPVTATAGSIDSAGSVTLLVAGLPANGVNGLTWQNAAIDVASTSIGSGVFRTASAPLKVGVLQLQSGAAIGTGNDQGVISGAFTGSVDYQRGIVRWVRALTEAASLSYNAVFLQYLPLDASILGLETARLPLDGKVPIFRPGGLVIVHNTQTYNLPNPLVKDTVYNVGRERIAYMRVKTATGATVSSTLYTADYDAGTLVFPLASDLAGLAQPFSVEHRIEDMVLCSIADISGKLTFTRALTHVFPANTSFASSAVIIGDVFARAHNYIEQVTWTTVWSNTLIGSAPTANYNETLNPIEVTNKGAITERWALIFTNTTTFRIVGEFTGEIGTGSTGADCAPVNPATGVPYFTIRAAGWGAGWSTGNVYRFNTAACGAPVWVVRTVLQGPATLQDDKFTIAFRGDVDRP